MGEGVSADPVCLVEAEQSTNFSFMVPANGVHRKNTKWGPPHIHLISSTTIPRGSSAKPEKLAVRFWGAGKTESLCKRGGSCQQDTGSTCQEEKCRHLITPKSRSSMSEEKADGEDGRRHVAKGSSPTQTHQDTLGSNKKEKKKQGWPRRQPGDKA